MLWFDSKKKNFTSGINALHTCTCLCVVQFSSGCQGKHTSRQRNAGAAVATMRAQLAASYNDADHGIVVPIFMRHAVLNISLIRVIFARSFVFKKLKQTS